MAAGARAQTQVRPDRPAPDASTPRPRIRIPKVNAAPKLEDFTAAVAPAAAVQFKKVAGFIQQLPTDGAPATQETVAYLGYDESNLYVVWVCHDSEPKSVRAHVSRRENILDDDYVQLKLDTFADERHAMVFAANAHGIQMDGLWSEGDTALDNSWDGVWNSRGAVTATGYVVLMSIPFRTLRFSPAEQREWGVTLLRVIARSGETDYWPRVSSRVAGELNQAAKLTGLEDVRPGRNLQLDPYISFRNFRALDTRDAANPRFNSSAGEFQGGLDAKLVLHEHLVLDATFNPDFSQVESDEPQNAVNQRFALYYPEKRPFFLENANYFDSAQGQYQLTPLVFTRNIADPDYGVKLTGKAGPWTLGILAADDKSPGEIVPEDDPLALKKATFFIAQVAHDIGAQSSIGVVYTGREFAGFYNRVGGIDVNLRLAKNWTSRFHSVMSSTLDRNSTGPATPANGLYNWGTDNEGVLTGSGRRFSSITEYQDITPGFRTETGFLQRSDIRRVVQYYHFYFRPENLWLLSWGPETSAELMYDHNGTVIHYSYSFDPVFAFRRNTYVAPIFSTSSDTLRPQDFAGLTYNAKFVQNHVGFVLGTNPIRVLSWRTLLMQGGTVNVVPPAGPMPNEADETSLVQTMTIRPSKRLQIDNTYILDRMVHSRTGTSVFTNHIIRSKWNYQLSRELSFRFIGQYNGLLASPTESSLQTTRNINYDFLLTYLLHPGTAFYVGYNSNLQNLLPGLCNQVPGESVCTSGTSGPVRTPYGFINDGRQFFFKISYLFQR